MWADPTLLTSPLSHTKMGKKKWPKSRTIHLWSTNTLIDGVASLRGEPNFWRMPPHSWNSVGFLYSARATACPLRRCALRGFIDGEFGGWCPRSAPNPFRGSNHGSYQKPRICTVRCVFKVDFRHTSGPPPLALWHTL